MINIPILFIIEYDDRWRKYIARGVIVVVAAVAVGAAAVIYLDDNLLVVVVVVVVIIIRRRRGRSVWRSVGRRSSNGSRRRRCRSRIL